MGRDLDRTIIIDNSPASYLFQPQNAIPCSSWFDDKNDTLLQGTWSPFFLHTVQLNFSSTVSEFLKTLKTYAKTCFDIKISYLEIAKKLF